jgi:hypothetical protein
MNWQLFIYASQMNTILLNNMERLNELNAAIKIATSNRYIDENILKLMNKTIRTIPIKWVKKR